MLSAHLHAVFIHLFIGWVQSIRPFPHYFQRFVELNSIIRALDCEPKLIRCKAKRIKNSMNELNEMK